MILVDGHCDTICTQVLDKKENLYNNSAHFDLDRARRYSGFVQFFAAWIDPEFYSTGAIKRAIQIIDSFYTQLELNKDYMGLCKNYKDIQKCINESKLAAILSIEGGEALQGELSSLRMFYKLGVRSLCLTWNNKNEIGYGVEAEFNSGLTQFGKSVIHEMNRLGMIIDVSHLSEAGFWDVISLTNSPIIASHSNAKAVCTHKRNLTNVQISGIAQNNGVIGINLYPEFLNDSGKANIKDIIKHIEHICSIAGPDNVGIGADFDGVDFLPEDICGVQDIGNIFSELAKLNYSQETIDKISNLNFLRIITKVLGE